MAKKPAKSEQPDALPEASDTEEFRNEQPPEKSDEGFRDDQGRFTGNPATLEEKVDALVKMARANGWSLPMELE